MNDVISVRVIKIQPTIVAVLIDGGVLRMAVCGEQMAIVELLDTLRHGIHAFASCVRVAVAADYPEDVVKAAIPLANVPAPVTGFLRTVGENLIHPTLFGADVPEVYRCQEYLDALLPCVADHPVGMLEILFIGSGEISGCRERTFSVAIHGSAKLVFDQIDDDRIESLATATLQIDFRLFPGEPGDEGPCCIALHQKRRSTLIHEMAVVRADVKGIVFGSESCAGVHQHCEQNRADSLRHRCSVNRYSGAGRKSISFRWVFVRKVQSGRAAKGQVLHTPEIADL